MEQESMNSQQADNGQNNPTADLMESIMACKNVDEFETLLQQHGIWLNTKAAESAFNSLRFNQAEELSDENLEAVTGGIGMYGSGPITFDDLMRLLVSSVS